MIDKAKWMERCAEAKTEKQKLEVVADYLTEDHLSYFGGYPHDCHWFGDEFAVASLDDRKERNATQLDIYTKKQMLDMFDEAMQWKTDNADMDFYDCFCEARI